MEIYDITIVGAGPAGLFAGFYAGMRQAKTKIIDSLPQLGGQLAALYPEKMIYDIPGYQAIKAGDLVTNLKEQLATFSHTYALEQEVTGIQPSATGLITVTTNRETHYTQSLVLALGNGSFSPRRLKLPEAPQYEGHGLDYFVADLASYAGKDVVIAGGGDSALDWALLLAPSAASVTLVHRRDNFRGHEHTFAQVLAHDNITLKTPFIIDQLTGQEHLRQLTLTHTKSGEKETLACDQLLVSYGFTSSLDLRDWQLEGDRRGITVASDMSTSLPGVYACGDIASYQGKVKLIAAGFGEAPTAVNNALYYLNPEQHLHPGHSTSLFKKVSNGDEK